DDRPSQRRSSAVAGTDRRVAHSRIERLIESPDRGGRITSSVIRPSGFGTARLPMSFLDRFKPQPRWKHPDAAVRAAAVTEIPDDDAYRGTLEELAASDEDVRVRTAAMERVADTGLLSRLARSEQDGELRRRITERLVAIAGAPADTDADAALALEGLDDPRQFSTIAKSSPHDTVRGAALGRVHEVKALGSVARHAADPQIALEAVARISDPAELLN